MSASEAPSRGEIVIYHAEDGSVALDVRLEQETIWLNLNQLAALFDRDNSLISRHLRNVFKEGELDREATVAKIATLQAEGGREVKRTIEYFNLDAIISVGYRVNSKRGTQFRIWATQVLRDHIFQGYTVNEKRLRDLNDVETIRGAFAQFYRATILADETDPNKLHEGVQTMGGGYGVRTDV